MRLRFDTTAFIRWDDDALKPSAVKSIRRASVVYVSALTAWEISIKVALGKLHFDRSVEHAIAEYGFIELPVTVRQGDRAGYVPRHHPDPFDRLLIAQAIEEGLTVLTSDRAFEQYQVAVEWL